MAGRDTSPDVVREAGYAGTGFVTASGANTFTAGPQTFSDSVDLAFGTTTGSMIGTGATQKIGFFGATPVPQISGSTDLLAGWVTLGLRAASSNPPLNLGTGAVTAGQLSVAPTATGVVLGLFNAPTGQAANIFDVQLNAASKLRVNSNGSLTFGGTVNITDAINLSFGTTNGSQIGVATNQKLAFHGSAGVIQRAGAAQAAVATTAASNVTPFGYTTAAQADAIVTLVNEIRAALVEKGLIKGAA